MWKFIKWTFKTFLFLTGLVPLIRCSSGYREKNGKISFNGKEIDNKSLVVLNEFFAKDSATAWYKEHAFSYADVPSFEAVDAHYAKDKNKVYYCDEYREGQNYYLTKKQTILELRNVHPGSFAGLGNGYGKDQSHAWFRGKQFSVKEVASLTSINPDFAKDNIHAYLDRQLVAGSDGKSFRLLDQNFASDTNHIYYYGFTGDAGYSVCVLPCNKATFRIIDYRYSKDDEKVFFLGFTVKDADPATFELLKAGYARDQHNVYFRYKKIRGAERESFTVYEANDSLGHDVAYARDRAAIFIDDQKLDAADAASFVMLGENYGRDHQHVFYKTGIVLHADPSSFTVYPFNMGNADAEDSAKKYHEGKIVTDD